MKKEEKKDESPVEDKKPAVVEKKPLFGGTNPFAKPSTSPLFGAPASGNPVVAPLGNLFAKPATSGAIFGTGATTTNPFGKPATAVGGIFGKPKETEGASSEAKPTTPSIFEAKKDTPSEEKPKETQADTPAPPVEDTKPKSLFSTPGSLFGASTAGALFQKSTNLFGNKPPGGGSGIFGGGTSLFTGKSSFVSSGGKEEEKDDDEEEFPPEQATFISVSKDPHIKVF